MTKCELCSQREEKIADLEAEIRIHNMTTINLHTTILQLTRDIKKAEIEISILRRENDALKFTEALSGTETQRIVRRERLRDNVIKVAKDYVLLLEKDAGDLQVALRELMKFEEEK